MELQGKISAILPVQSGVSQATGNAWMKQEYVISYFWWPNQTQPTQMAFSIFGEDRIKEANVQLNDEVKINYYVEAHEYNGRYFNEIRCTNVTKIGASAQNQAAQAAQNAAVGQSANGDVKTAPAGANQTAGPQPTQNANDDLPF